MSEAAEFRGRVCEVLALLADRESQREYQRNAPHVDVAAELFNQWDDAYHPDDAAFARQFDARERAAMATFAALLDAIAEETPQQLPPLDEFIATEAWRRLSAGAAVALAAMDR